MVISTFLRMTIPLAVVTSLVTACAVGQEHSTSRNASVDVEMTNRPATGEPRGIVTKVAIGRHGASVLNQRVSAAGILQNTSENHIRDIELKLTFVDDDGDIVRRLPAYVPFCPSGQRCWWSRIYTADQFPSTYRSIAGVRVRVVAATRTRASKRVVAFDVHRDDRERVEGTAPRDEGLVFVVGIRNGKPVSGLFVNISESAGLPRRFRIERSVYPVPRNHSLRAFMYPTQVSMGD